MKKLLYIVLFLFVSSVIWAGDYMLVVANDLHTECAVAKYRNVKSSVAVSRSLKQYFYGQKTDIGILRVAFANGHIHFCGKQEIEDVYQTLIKLKENGASVNRSDLDDFIRLIQRIRK